MPLRTVEKEGFKSLVHALYPQYELTSRKYPTTKVLYSKTREVIVKEVSKESQSGSTSMPDNG